MIQQPRVRREGEGFRALRWLPVLRVGLFAVIVAIAPGRAFAEPLRLDRMTVARLARVSSLEARIATGNVNAALAATRGLPILSYDNPSISVQGGARFGVPTTPEVRGGLAIPIDIGGRIGARRDAAAADARQATADADETRRQLVREALVLHALALKSQIDIDLARARRALAQRLVEIAQRRVAAGDLGEGEVGVLALELAREDARLATATSNASANARSLAVLVGSEPSAEVTVVGDLVPHDEPPPLETLRAAVEQRSDVRRARATQAATAAQVDVATAERWPTLSVIGAYEYHEVTNFALAGVSLPLPLFNNNRAAIGQREALAAAATTQVSASRTRAAGEVEAAFVRYVGAKNALQHLERAAALSKEVTARSARAYELGKVGIAELLAVRRATNEAFAEKVDGELAVAIARIELDAASGCLP